MDLYHNAYSTARVSPVTSRRVHKTIKTKTGSDQRCPIRSAFTAAIGCARMSTTPKQAR
eukprot:jgi/Botrbrau1/19243/Bobra.0077s0139.1